MPGQFRPRGVTMRDCLKNRAGFDRVLMAVAATFLTVSATSALAPRPIRRATAPPNSRSTRRSRVPNPPTSRPRPSTTSSWTRTAVGAATQRRRRRRRPRPSHPTSSPLRPPTRNKADTGKSDTATTTPRRSGCRPPQRRPPSPPRSRSRPQATSPPADQPVADKLRDMLGAKSLRYFDRKDERDRGREVLHRARLCAAVDARRRADRERQGRRSRA